VLTPWAGRTPEHIVLEGWGSSSEVSSFVYLRWMGCGEVFASGGVGRGKASSCEGLMLGHFMGSRSRAGSDGTSLQGEA
jgi:hypothetical protein